MIAVKVPGHEVKEASIDRYPDSCPMCHRSVVVTPPPFTEVSREVIQAICQCPAVQCHRLFISTYSRNPRTGYFSYRISEPVEPAERLLDGRVKEISPEFAQTYQEAWRAKDLNLTKIAGPGFRRSLEFLVKDYASRYQPDEIKEAVRRKPLVQCIKDHIREDGIRTVAERAAWLGNDETHYLRKWEDKDINDLIDLVDSVAGWIVIHLKTEQLKKTMVDPKAAKATQQDG